MSWSVTAVGAKQDVAAEAVRQLDLSAANYSTLGDPEQQDIFACKARILALLAAMKVDTDKQIRIEANGSHSWNDDKNHPVSAAFSVRISVF